MSTAEPFDRIRNALAGAGDTASDHDLNGTPPGDGPNRLVEAGVLIPLITRASGVQLVLTRRSVRLKHHAGQISFPGGRVEARDGDAQQAALREAHEEIGLDPADVEILGRCPNYETATGFRISPVVGVIRREVTFVPQEEEVEEIFEVPLDIATDPGKFTIESRIWRGARRHYHVLAFGRHHIWGATAGILHGLACRMSAQCQ